ncbi:MAG: hypothetical protein K0R71_1685 [Bacillales bacterium]|jgi:uncharacterized protein (DUF2225 family)|nr:hypothetical protein [Bacillales bacterium]
MDNINKEDFIFKNTVDCPVCGSKVDVLLVKTSSLRIKGKDSDFYVEYEPVNPYFYDVWLCNICGYASMKSDFKEVKSYQIEKIKNEISTKWHFKTYGNAYSADEAIIRLKLALLNYDVAGAKESKKAMACLKIAWLYRSIQDEENETLYIKKALETFKEAYSVEDFPICGMDKFTTMYLIGELHRRAGNFDEALKQFSYVMTAQEAKKKLKEMAYDQKELIREMKIENEPKKEDDLQNDISEGTNKKQGLFSKLFK